MRVERCVRCGEIIDKVNVVTISEQGAVGSFKGLVGKNKSFGLCGFCAQKVITFITSGKKESPKKVENGENGGIHFHA